MKILRFIFPVALCLIAGAAGAQDEPQTLMQPREPAPIVNGDAPQMENPAQVEVSVSSQEDEIRQLRGQIEQDQNQIHKLSDALDKLQRDTDFRFNELNHPAAATPTKSKSTAAPSSSEPTGPTSGGDGLLHPPEPEGSAPTTPRELYQYAFRLFNQTKYQEAAAAFDSFTKQYPKDPLVGNAFYWEGQTYYLQRDYVTAADFFRQGFEALPNGPKAADNLLKLAMSLDAQNRDKEACVVLSQIVTKFKKNSVGVTEKAQSEIKRIGCQ